MQTKLLADIIATPQGQEADRILRTCVHCGFCTATCPTYQLLGDELDGPRGRIYLIKQMLEGNEVTRKTQTHLDRCLTCRSCETTCPSGVEYGKLIDIGREIAEHRISRNPLENFKRYALRKIVPYPQRFAVLAKLGQLAKPLLPTALKRKVPDLPKREARPTASHARKMLILEGCAQSVSTPQTNSSAARILDKLGIQLLTTAEAGCCGAVSQHLSVPTEAQDFMRRNIDAWWPYIEQGAEAIISTASGCGVMVKDYGELLINDTQYAAKAKRVSEMTRDISEILANEDLGKLQLKPGKHKVAFHCPCTLQHALKLNGKVELLLQKIGFDLAKVSDSHMCCGSAGTYSVLQPVLSQQLLKNKLNALQLDAPDVIATANAGCQMYLATQAKVEVKHWIELLDQSNVA
ncbi:MAG: glycolate oxidase subunit GlcF [Gallionellaceae bacterium]|jgi:glycolate oxidase iron-sulfur subunit